VKFVFSKVAELKNTFLPSVILTRLAFVKSVPTKSASVILTRVKSEPTKLPSVKSTFSILDRLKFVLFNVAPPNIADLKLKFINCNISLLAVFSTLPSKFVRLKSRDVFNPKIRLSSFRSVISNRFCNFTVVFGLTPNNSGIVGTLYVRSSYRIIIYNYEINNCGVHL